MYIILLLLSINKWGSQTIGQIYMNIAEGMEELFEEHYTYKNILTLIQYIYVLVQDANC